jgi:hypothetical protein
MRRHLLPTGIALCLGAAAAAGAATTAGAEENPPMPGFQAAASDPTAIQIADQVMQAMGGRPAWDTTRYLHWVFFGRRTHYWDKSTGDVRIEAGDQLVLMNINTKKGRAWEKGVEVTQPDSLAKCMQKGFAWWTNDMYWMFMPYKLKDTGVRLRSLGERPTKDGKPADVIEVTFAKVGLTPENKYDVYVDKATHLVTQWSYYEKSTDPEPSFTMPWHDWRRVGHIMLAADHGKGDPWVVATYDQLPPTVFTSPDPVAVQ